MPCCLSATLLLPLYVSQATATVRALLPLGRPLYTPNTTTHQLAVHDARGHFAAPYSYQRLVPPSSLLFSICGHIRPKSALLHPYYIRTVRSDEPFLLPRVCLLYCTACQQCYLSSPSAVGLPGISDSVLHQYTNPLVSRGTPGVF